MQNSIVEATSTDPDNPAPISTLDTLMISPLLFNPTSSFPLENEDLSQGGRYYHSYPVMTYYHGRECEPFVFSGFNFWYWKRQQCIDLVDWVLQDVWGIPRDGTAPRGPAVASPRQLAARSGAKPSRR